MTPLPFENIEKLDNTQAILTTVVVLICYLLITIGFASITPMVNWTSPILIMHFFWNVGCTEVLMAIFLKMGKYPCSMRITAFSVIFTSVFLLSLCSAFFTYLVDPGLSSMAWSIGGALGLGGMTFAIILRTVIEEE